MGKMKNIIYGANVLAEPIKRIAEGYAKASTDFVPEASINLGNPVGVLFNLALDVIKYIDPIFEESRFYSYPKLLSAFYGLEKTAFSIAELYNQSGKDGFPLEATIGLGLNSLFTYLMVKDAAKSNRLRKDNHKAGFAEDLEIIANTFR